MLEKILVCLDGSAPAERILPYVTKEAAALRGKMVLLCVIDLPETMLSINLPGSPAVPVSTQGSVKRTFTEEKAADDYLKAQAESLKTQGLDVDYVVLRHFGRDNCQLCAGK